MAIPTSGQRVCIFYALLTIALLPAAGSATLRSDFLAVPTAMRPVGPPPLAPVHGHRHRHGSGVQLRFDADLGAYVVAEAHAVYFFRGVFLRMHRGEWQSSPSVRGPWITQRTEWVPLALRVKHYPQER